MRLGRPGVSPGNRGWFGLPLPRTINVENMVTQEIGISQN